MLTMNPRNRRRTIAVVASAFAAIMLTVTAIAGCSDGETQREGDTLSSPLTPAPELKGASAWLNTTKPLTLDDLRGQVVLLDFWTYCCINCLHVLPDLKYLEHKYRDEPFVVVGIHSGKFDEEKDAGNIRQAILRHNIDHPVAVDNDYEIWNAFGVQAWPTIILIDPQGRIAGAVTGEGHRDTLDRTIHRLLEQHRKMGTLAEPMRFRTERTSFESAFLEFPGKLLADAAGQRLFISDTNHHRIVVADLDGLVQLVIGDGSAGFTDGEFETTQFHQPQGLALSPDRQTLFVADTENHAVRTVDLVNGVVSTLAGTGKLNYDRNPKGPARSTGLNSPWDLSLVEGRLYLAMAGAHELWVIDLQSAQLSLFAGTGREAGFDGPNRRATFAQPSGLTSDGKHLYVADSEISSIRTVELGPTGRTTTLAGSGGLFKFGDTDGVGKAARFQHPLGVAIDGTDLYVADTFNHRIRRVNVRTGQVTTWLGPDLTDVESGSQITLDEPGGLSIAGGTLYIADTNNHRIVAVELSSKVARVVNVRLAQRHNANLKKPAGDEP